MWRVLFKLHLQHVDGQCDSFVFILVLGYFMRKNTIPIAPPPLPPPLSFSISIPPVILPLPPPPPHSLSLSKQTNKQNTTTVTVGRKEVKTCMMLFNRSKNLQPAWTLFNLMIFNLAISLRPTYRLFKNSDLDIMCAKLFPAITVFSLYSFSLFFLLLLLLLFFFFFVGGGGRGMAVSGLELNLLQLTHCVT